jgi:hypothetical protein
MEAVDARQNERVVRLGRVSGKITRHPEDKSRRGQVFEGTLTNISAMGVGIDTEADLSDTTLVSLVVEVEDLLEVLKYKLDGEVRWRTPPGTHSVHAVGILLVGTPRRHFRKWQDMVFAISNCSGARPQRAGT